MTRLVRCAVIAMLLLILGCVGALAGDDAAGYLMEPPHEVLDHTALKWPEYRLEDYCEISTPMGDYGFALLLKGKERFLAGYRDTDGKMAYWFKNAGAVPQGSEPAWFSVSRRGEQYVDLRTDMMHVSEGMSFSVTRLDSEGGAYEQAVSYRYKGKGFHLVSYKHAANDACYIEDGYLEFWDFGYWRKEGRVTGEVQTDIRYVSFNTLPENIQKARQTVTTAPDVPVGKVLGNQGGPYFTAKAVKFTGGKKYPVYTGPGEAYVRSGSGKGSVSTNDWIQVFGRYGNWILIQYDISAERYRIGWIEAKALPKGTVVQELELVMLDSEPYNNVLRACDLTDDPLNSEQAIAHLPVGTQITELVFDFGGWSYVRVEINGQTMCGFVPSDCIDHG